MSKRYVIVTPLAPPFHGRVTFFDFEERTLAVSSADADRIFTLLNNYPLGRYIMLSAVGDRIKVEAVPH